MSLNRESIGDAALQALQDGGLSSLSMRGVATLLGVRQGALYWHVESKQELLALLADRILAGEPFADGRGAPRDATRLAIDLRASLLQVRDGSEVVSFARALHPDRDMPVSPIRAAMLAGVEGAMGPRTEVELGWAAGALVHFVLGFVAEEQNRSELARAGVHPEGSGVVDARAGDIPEAFVYGVRVLVEGSRPPNCTSGERDGVE